MYQITSTTKKILNLKSDLRFIQGGTSAGKTISILSILIDAALKDETPTLTSICSESFPHLRRGAMRDFLNILKEHKYYNESQWSRTEFIYTFPNGSQIEFFSMDDATKLRGGRRDRGFINECNNVSYEAFSEFEVRTKGCVFLDWNPSVEFWYESDVKKNRKHDHIIVTYKDNEALSSKIVDKIEARKYDENWWKVYGLGQVGSLEGVVFNHWNIVDKVPEGAKLVSRGLDFGFTNDPAVLVDIYEYNGGYVADQIFYRKGMHNDAIAKEILDLDGEVLTYGDSAEPKSIDEIKNYGVSIVSCIKGKGSVSAGIDHIQSKPLSVTSRSVEGIKELRNYVWATDKSGKSLNVPIDKWNHFIDAMRYGIYREDDIWDDVDVHF